MIRWKSLEAFDQKTDSHQDADEGSDEQYSENQTHVSWFPRVGKRMDVTNKVLCEESALSIELSLINDGGEPISGKAMNSR
jgi:hypothetical protein